MNGFTRCIVPTLLATVMLTTGCSSTPDDLAATRVNDPASGAVELPFIARGNEPFWRAIVEPGQLVLERLGERTVELRYETIQRSATGRIFRADGEGIRISVITARQLCRDSMTGMPYPNQVRLEVNGDPFRGCGGNPEQLLQGAEWVVEDIDGSGIIDSSRLTIDFRSARRVAGNGSCNPFRGEWTLTGEGLGLTRLASTRKTCAPALMDQEGRFLALLSDVSRFDIGHHGELLLIASDGRTLRAFQPTE